MHQQTTSILCKPGEVLGCILSDAERARLVFFRNWPQLAALS